MPYDFSLYDQATVVWKFAFSYRGKQNYLKFWRLARREGIWSFNKKVPWNTKTLSEAWIRPDQAIASYETVVGPSLALFQRRRDIEKPFVAALGVDVVSPLDMVVCDKCGKGTLTTVERPAADGPRVLCRPCAALDHPSPC